MHDSLINPWPFTCSEDGLWINLTVSFTKQRFSVCTCYKMYFMLLFNFYFALPLCFKCFINIGSCCLLHYLGTVKRKWRIDKRVFKPVLQMTFTPPGPWRQPNRIRTPDEGQHIFFCSVLAGHNPFFRYFTCYWNTFYMFFFSGFCLTLVTVWRFIYFVVTGCEPSFLLPCCVCLHFLSQIWCSNVAVRRCWTVFSEWEL